MKVLLIGDINASSGREVVRKYLPKIKEKFEIDFTIANVDNIAHGIGVTVNTICEMDDLGIDVYTGGNHIFDKKDQFSILGSIPNLLRPMNFPSQLPCKSFLISEVKGKRIMTAHFMGQTYMSQNLNDPFEMVNNFLNEHALLTNVDAIFIDFHAEATAEKYGFAHMLDGKMTCVFGTHTHVQTNDNHVLPGGTAYISDLGMCGNYDSVIGMEKQGVIKNFLLKFNAVRMESARGDGTFCGAVVDVDESTGLAKNIDTIQVGGVLKHNQDF